MNQRSRTRSPADGHASLRVLFAILTFAGGVSAFSQSSPADGGWSGQIQCQLDVQRRGYVRHETQTWTLTHNAPASKNGEMRIYPATWTATGQGGIQRAVGQRQSLAHWNVNVPPTDASIAMFVRKADGQFIIRIWQRPGPSYSGVSASRQMVENGVAQPTTNVNTNVNEWTLPWIEAKPGAAISGKLSVPTESLGADLTPPGISPTAECTWQFSRAVSTVGDEQSVNNSRTLNDYATSLQQSWTKQRGTGTVSASGQGSLTANPLPPIATPAPLTQTTTPTQPKSADPALSGSSGAPSTAPSLPSSASASVPSAPTPSPALASSSGAADLGPDDVEGLPVSATIGSAGGTLTSPDGRLTISIPAGALAAPAKVGIQPLWAKAPGALASDFRLTPNGQTFAKPVTLTFTYSSEEASANAPDQMRVAMREANGSWSVANATRDAARRTLTIATSHFSDWSYVGGLRITPASAAVEVNRAESLSVIFCGDPSAANASNTAAVLVECGATSSGLQLRQWSVNGVPGGSAALGRVTSSGSVRAGASYAGALYTAPSRVPSQNPVSVSVEVDTGRGRQVLVSTIKVLERIPKYSGSFMGSVQIPYGGYHRVSTSDLLLSYEPRDADKAFGDRRFVGAGTAIVTAIPISCKASTTSIKVHAELVLHGVDRQDHSPSTGAYEITVGDTANMIFECGEPSTTMTIPFPAYATSCPARLADAKTVGNQPAFGYALAVIDGSGTCTPAEGNKVSAKWLLLAIQ